MVSVVVVNYNAGDLLRQCVQSILDYSDNLVENIIVVDNASTDKSIDLLPEHPIIIVVKNINNNGFGAACNQGYALSRSEFVLLLNPDTRLLPQTLANSVDLMRRHQQISILGVKHFNEESHVAPSCSRFPSFADLFAMTLGLHQIAPKLFRSPILLLDYDYERPGKVDQVMGAFMFIRRSVIEKVGSFMDERFFVYFEDLDFSKRVFDSGGISWYEPSISIFHKGCGTTEAIKAKRLYYSVNSRLLYIQKYFRGPAPAILFVFSLVFEPFARSFGDLIKNKGKGIGQIFQGYKMLYKHLFFSKQIP